MSDELRWQDEILQLMYWMKGERLAAEVSVAQMLRFLPVATGHLEAALARMEDSKLIMRAVNKDGSVAYVLTELGATEGGRRFADEFASYLGKESHIECDDPDCDCHTPEFTGTCRHLQ